MWVMFCVYLKVYVCDGVRKYRYNYYFLIQHFLSNTKQPASHDLLARTSAIAVIVLAKRTSFLCLCVL